MRMARPAAGAARARPSLITVSARLVGANCSFRMRSSRLCSGSNSRVSDTLRSSRISTLATSRISVKSADGADRALGALQHLEAIRAVRQQRAAPAPRAEGADRRQRQHAGAERQDRAVGGEIVGGAAGGRRDQDAVADQLGQAHDAVDGMRELRRLPRSGAAARPR